MRGAHEISFPSTGGNGISTETLSPETHSLSLRFFQVGDHI